MEDSGSISQSDSESGELELDEEVIEAQIAELAGHLEANPYDFNAFVQMIKK